MHLVQFTGDATPSYILGATSAMKLVSVLPHAKIIVVLRDPVARFYSEYVTDTTWGQGARGFGGAGALGGGARRREE